MAAFYEGILPHKAQQETDTCDTKQESVENEHNQHRVCASHGGT